LHTPTASSLDNKLLAKLPRGDFETLAAHLTHVSLPQGQIVYEAGDEVDYIYFPTGGMFSLLAVMRDGKAIETAISRALPSVGLGSFEREGKKRGDCVRGAGPRSRRKLKTYRMDCKCSRETGVSSGGFQRVRFASERDEL
jgi:hypothetical protein